MSLNYNREYNKDIRNWLGKVFAHAKALSEIADLERGCPVCSSASHSFYANNDYFNYVKCNQCSLLFQNPTINPAKVDSGFKGDDEILMEYFRLMLKYKTGIPEKPDPATDGKLKDIYRLKQKGKLLDIGCSVGDFLHKAKHFYEVEGVEINPVTSEMAKKYFTVHQKFLSELNLKKSYDIVTMHQILYGVHDPVGLMKDIHKTLDDEGILYINTPNADSFAMDFYKGKANNLYGYTTQNVFNESSLNKLADLSGFKVISFRTEWLDMYMTDILIFMQEKTSFIHKRNCQVEGYEEKIKLEDEMQNKMKLDLGKKGNYIVAVLKKA
jgi:SAM-dependent methyltransferase